MMTPSRQRGLTMTGFLFVSVVVLILALLSFRVIPAYIEYFSVIKALEGALNDSKDLTKMDVRKRVERRIGADYIDSVNANDIDVTKSGNVVIRTQLIESAWHFRGRPVAGKTLQERQSHVGPATVARASVAHQRLAGRYRRLTARGLPPNVINVAVARELAGFMWAEMTSPA